jgi:hypothetical protein
VSTTSPVDLLRTVPPVRTQMQRPRPADEDTEPEPVTARDLFALLVAPLGAVLTLVMAVIVIVAMPWQGGLLLTGVVLAVAGYVLGTRA